MLPNQLPRSRGGHSDVCVRRFNGSARTPVCNAWTSRLRPLPSPCRTHVGAARLAGHPSSFSDRWNGCHVQREL